MEERWPDEEVSDHFVILNILENVANANRLNVRCGCTLSASSTCTGWRNRIFEEKKSFNRIGGAMGAPASALYSLADENGVLAASRAGTGELFAQVGVDYPEPNYSQSCKLLKS